MMRKTKPNHRAASIRNRAKKQAVYDAARDKACQDCGVKYPAVCMDFDHRPGEVKLFPVSKWRQVGMDALLAEIAKCDLVCANCHRIRTWLSARPIPDTRNSYQKLLDD